MKIYIYLRLLDFKESRIDLIRNIPNRLYPNFNKFTNDTVNSMRTRCLKIRNHAHSIFTASCTSSQQDAFFTEVNGGQDWKFNPK